MPDADFAALLAAVLGGSASAPPAPAGPEPANCTVCGTVLDPVLIQQGDTTHPGCDPEPATTPDAAPADEGTVAMIRRVCGAHSSSSARSQQKVIGLSEIGDPCDRAVAYRLLCIEPVNVGRDNHLADVGTAWHAWVAEAFEAENRRLGRQRYIIEQRVFLTDGYSGTADLFDVDTGTVIDHKLLGVTSLRKIRNGDIPPKYRTQLHAYGYGHTRAGRQVNTVALACYPRSDNLAGDFGGQGLHIWTESYSEQIALSGIDRLSRLVETATRLDVESHPERWALIPATPSDDCRYCPYFRPGHGPAGADGCPGAPASMPTSMPGIA